MQFTVLHTHNSYKSRYTNTTLEILAEIEAVNWNEIIFRNTFHNESICANTASFKEHKTHMRSLKCS